MELQSQSQHQKIGILTETRVNSKDLFQANEMHSSYLQIMKDRERMIEGLTQQIKRLSQGHLLNVEQEQASHMANKTRNPSMQDI